MSKLAPGDKIGNNFPYRVIKQLGKGEGGMSVVYLASTKDEIDQPKMSDLVALKIANVQSEYRQFYKDTLDNEIEHLRRLKHPGIVYLHTIRGKTLPDNAIYSARTELAERPWFSVLEYLAGESLAELLKQQKKNKLDPGLALRITHKLAKTLEYVHRQGYVHLDMKPENVVFRQPMTDAKTIDPVLVDFGIARAINQGGLEAGTLIWLPPERVAFLHNQSHPPEAMIKPNPSIDMYALGLILYSMLAGKLPYQGSQKKITQAILQGNPTAPSTYNSDLKPELDELVLSAIAKNPAHRPTATQFAREIERLMNRPEYQQYQMPSLPPTGDGENGGFFKFLRSFILTLLIVGGLGASFFYLQPLLNTPPTPTTAPTMTPVVEVTEAAVATEVPATATTIPTASIEAGNSSVSATEEPPATATAIPTSTPLATFTPAAEATFEQQTSESEQQTEFVEPTLTPSQ